MDLITRQTSVTVAAVLRSVSPRSTRAIVPLPAKQIAVKLRDEMFHLTNTASMQIYTTTLAIG